jgi:hypothetical protein
MDRYWCKYFEDDWYSFQYESGEIDGKEATLDMVMAGIESMNMAG